MPSTPDTSPFHRLPGLVWAFRFDTDGRGQVLDIDALDGAELLREQPGWPWLHFNQGDARSAGSIQNLPGLPEAARQTLLDHEAHTGIVLEDDVAHGVLLDWQHGGVDNFSRTFLRCEQDTAWLRFLCSARLLVTSRSHALRSLEQVRRHAAAGTLYETPASLLEAVVEGFAAAVAHAAPELDNDRIEDRELALLRRQAVHLTGRRRRCGARCASSSSATAASATPTWCAQRSAVRGRQAPVLRGGGAVHRLQRRRLPTGCGAGAWRGCSQVA